MRVEVVAYDDSWRSAFQQEAARIYAALGPVAGNLHHIGSTSVPGMFAKPIIDILIETHSLANLDAETPALKKLGYEALGEFGIAGRRYFRNSNPAGIRTHQIHAFESPGVEIERHLTFRDYLRAHPKIAAQYSELKRHLANEFPHDIDAYMNGKDAFIKTHEAAAMLDANS